MGSLTFFVRTVLSCVVWFPTACSTHRGVWQRRRLTDLVNFGPDVLLVGTSETLRSMRSTFTAKPLWDPCCIVRTSRWNSAVYSLSSFCITDSISLPGWLTKNMGSSGLFDRQKEGDDNE